MRPVQSEMYLWSFYNSSEDCMASNNFSSKIICDIFPPRPCDNTHINVLTSKLPELELF